MTYLFDAQVVLLIDAVKVRLSLLPRTCQVLNVHQRNQSSLTTCLRLLILCAFKAFTEESMLVLVRVNFSYAILVSVVVEIST